MMKRRILIVILMAFSFVAGFSAGHFFGQTKPKPKPMSYYEIDSFTLRKMDIESSHVDAVEDQKNEELVLELESVLLEDWGTYVEGAHKDPIYITDDSMLADFVTIYSDGEVCAGKTLTLRMRHKIRIKILYDKITKSKYDKITKSKLEDK